MASDNPLVTIGIPVYNAEQYLKEALDSVLAQDYENLEIVVVNDASSDDSVKIIESYHDPRILFINSDRNYGVAAARQRIKTLAKGDFLTFLDADDVYHTDRVKALLDHSNVTKADIVCDRYERIDGFGNPLPGQIGVPDYIGKDKSFTRLFERNYMIPHPLIARRCFSQVDYDTTLKVSEDYDYWLKCSVAGFRFSNLNAVKLKYRISPNSLSSDVKRNLKATRKILEKYSVNRIIHLYRDRGLGQGPANYMACLQYLFRGKYQEALKFTGPPWPGGSDIDRSFYEGTLALKTGDKDRARKALQRHLKEFPDSPAGYNNMGVMKRIEGGKGKSFFQRALELFPGYCDARKNLEEPGAMVITLTQIRREASR